MTFLHNPTLASHFQFLRNQTQAPDIFTLLETHTRRYIITSKFIYKRVNVRDEHCVSRLDHQIQLT